MGTNFYWTKIPREFENYKLNVEKYIGDVDDNPDNVLLHIGKRSAAGSYCYECGTTLNKCGTDYVHGGDNIDWYEQCPICGKEGSPISSFRWTMMRHKWLAEKLADEGCTKKCIVDEYGDSYSPMEFLNEVIPPIEFQSCCEFC